MNDMKKDLSLEKIFSVDEVAHILLDAFGDDCACNFNGIDEWLPCVCKHKEHCLFDDSCSCWKEYLLNLDKKKEYEELGFDKFWEKHGD